MRLNFSWSFRWSASILTGLLAIAAGCSPPSDNNVSSGTGPGGSSAQNQNSGSPATVPDRVSSPIPAIPESAAPAPASLPTMMPDTAPKIPLVEAPKTTPKPEPAVNATPFPETKPKDLTPVVPKND